MQQIWRVVGPVGQAASCANELTLPEVVRRHADAHRWWESERRGLDVGEWAYRDWSRLYWRPFCRWRHLEHLLAICRFREFGRESFGRLARPEALQNPILAFCVDKYLRDGWENLNLFSWAPDEYSRTQLLDALELIDINAARIDPPAWLRWW